MFTLLGISLIVYGLGKILASPFDNADGCLLAVIGLIILACAHVHHTRNDP